MRILPVSGNRPQFVKAAAVAEPLRAEHEEVLVHTGQHHDDELSEIFFRELGVPRPEHELGIAGGSNTSQTARMLAALDGLVAGIAPGPPLLYRGTNSTLPRAPAGAPAPGSRPPRPAGARARSRTRARLRDAGLLEALETAQGVRLTSPLGYLEFTALLVHARAVLTDSGGVQKEAYLARVPCVTMRSTTEWVETVETGWNTLVDLDAEAARAALERPPPDDHPALYGD